MAVIKSYPPNYRDILLALPDVAKNEKAVFCYGDDLYNPSGGEIEADLLLHEQIHSAQQKAIGVENWWRKFLTDPYFRFDQELSAFSAQLAYGKKVYPVKTSDKMKHDFAVLLSGKQYQTHMSYQEAEIALRRKTREFDNTVV